MYMQIMASILFLFPAPVFAQYMGDVFNKSRPFSFEVVYTSYSDIVKNASNPQDELAETLGVNANWRFYRTFSLTGSYGSTTGTDWSYYGLALKVDLPGFFFINGLANHFVRSSKLRRLNTYASFGKYFANQVGLTDSFVDDKLSLGADVFFAGNIYLNLDLSLLSHQGNQFLAPAIGLGYEF